MGSLQACFFSVPYLRLSMAAQPQVRITSCALGGHLLGRGTAVQKAIKGQVPNANVENRCGCPLQFSISVDGKQVLGGIAGACAILQMLTCCTSPSKVAENVVASCQINES